MSGEFVDFLVLSRHSKNVKQGMEQCYSSVLFGKQRKIHPRGVRASSPKRGEEKRSPGLNFGSSFYMFFLLPLSLPCVNWPGQEGCLFYLRSSLRCLDLPLFYFCGLLATTFWTPYVNWASQECCLFYLRSSLQPSDLPLFYFCRFSPSLSFSHCHSGLLSLV